MVGELGYRVKADGVDQTVQKLKQLHEEVRSGAMKTKDYTKAHRELTLAGRASSQEFNDIKGAIASANPNLMELTKTMSLFGGTANVAMSALNTINLALLSGSSAAQSLSQQYQKNADDYNAFIRLYESPQYGPGSPVTEAAYQKYQADLNTTSNLQKQLGVASLDTGISVALSAISMVGSMSQTYTALKAIQWDRVFSAITSGATSALGGVTWFAGAVLLPLAAAVAAFEGAYYLIRALNPQYAQSMDELSQIIEKNWNVSGIEAALIAPFVGAYLGFASLEDQWKEDLINFANSIINILNTIPNAINSMHIPGITLGTISNIDPYNGNNSAYNDAIKDLNINASGSTATGIGPNTPYSTYTSNNPIPNADQLGAPNVSQIQESLQNMQDPTKLTATNSTQTIAELAGIRTQLDQNNQSLTAINSGVAGLLEPITNQETAAQQLKDSLTNVTIPALQQRIAYLSTQPQTSLDATEHDPDTGAPIYISVPSGAATEMATDQQQLAQQQAALSGLDNYTSGLGPVLQSIGLSAESGIGSIISGALGDAAGIGGAGISEAQLQQFAQKGDYGVFTQAFENDNNPNGVTGGYGNAPTAQQQANAWLASFGYTPDSNGNYTPAQLALANQALGPSAGGTGGAQSSGSYDPTGAFGGLPGEYGNPSSVNVTVNNNIAGSLLSQQDLNTTVSNSVKDSLLGVGWG